MLYEAITPENVFFGIVVLLFSAAAVLETIIAIPHRAWKRRQINEAARRRALGYDI